MTIERTKDFFGPPQTPGRWRPDRRIEYDWRPVESWQGMPIGTGRTGAVVWAPNGLALQVSHTDCWSGDGSLPSLLRVEVNLSGNPFSNCQAFTQTLDLERAVVRVRADTEDGSVEAAVRAHPELDIIWVSIEDRRKNPGLIRVVPSVWRQGVAASEGNAAVFFTETNVESAFCELNRRSGVTAEFLDPLRGRVRGSALAVDGLTPVGRGYYFEGSRSEGETGIEGDTGAVGPRRRWSVFIAAGSQLTDEAQLRNELTARLKRIMNMHESERVRSHEAWWSDFWRRSYIELKPDSPLQPLRAAWTLNRYFAASTMKGDFPPKFNGSIFLYEFDRRSWGGPYWFQNTRLMYWPLLRSGDADFLYGLFRMYRDALDFARARVERVYGHAGAIFIETMHFWGAARAGDASPGSGVTNRYIKAHFSGSLELLMMMTEYLRHRPTDEAVSAMLAELAEPILDFFFEHFPRRDDRLFLQGGQALETWWDADDPADQVAGLRAVLPRLIQLGKGLRWDEAVGRWEAYASMLPALPQGRMRVENGRWRPPSAGIEFLPAVAVRHPKKENMEDPELYAVWPFNLVGLGASHLDEGRATYGRRLHPDPVWGWSQTAVWAARLGLAEEAANQGLKHFLHAATLPGGLMTSPGRRLPGRPGVHDCAYFDAPGALAAAVGEMLLQDHGEELAVLPAWPKSEPVAFRLHAAEAGAVEIEHGSI